MTKKKKAKKVASSNLNRKPATTWYQYRIPFSVQTEQTLKLCLNYNSTSVTITVCRFRSIKKVQNSNFATEVRHSPPFQDIFLALFSYLFIYVFIYLLSQGIKEELSQSILLFGFV